MLGQRRCGVVLVDLQDRVLWPPPLGHQVGSQDRLRALDRRTLQPQTPSLLDRHAHPSTLRKATTSDGTSRLNACPPFGVNLTTGWVPPVLFLVSAPARAELEELAVAVAVVGMAVAPQRAGRL